MKYSTAPNRRLVLVIAALALVFCPALLSRSRAASDVANPAKISNLRNQNLILLRRGILDTRTRVDTTNEDRTSSSLGAASVSKQMRIVQFRGPIQPGWIDALRATGAEIVSYIPNNAYVIRAAETELARVAALDAVENGDGARPIRWMGRLRATEKIDPTFTDEMLIDGKPSDVAVEIELADSRDNAAAIQMIERMASSINRAPRRFLDLLVLSITTRSNLLLDIASLDDVLFIAPYSPVSMHDECSAQIVAGNLVADKTQPSGPGYLTWLSSKGLDTQTDFAVDFTDSGLDRGSTSATQLHPDFLDSAFRSRVAYSFNYVRDGRADDQSGHGTIVASVAVGRGSSIREDPPGYIYGLGVDPAGMLGASRIFDERGQLPFRLSFTDVVSSAYSSGARISNNSWGDAVNSYDATAQEYDSLTRDAQPSAPGNQEMLFVFSVGNAGAGGHVGSPATAKNVIAVSASENYRPQGLDSCNLDGEGGIGPDGADNALDILRFSSGGPTADGRAKPDIAAPGTHIYGAASQSSGFFGEGLCPGVPVFQPPGQSLYTWSSGTSLAAPHISGAASLIRRFFVSRNLLGDNRPPSPALTKAHLLNSAMYMTGQNAGETLPGERQGWGLVDLSRAFDGASRMFVDQTKLFTASGQTFEVEGSLADRSMPLRVTLAWTDTPGSLFGPSIVNDLDLEVTVGGAVVYRGNNFLSAYSVSGGEPDALNNVESVYLPPEAIPQGAQGNFTITVRAANIAADGVPGNETPLDQDFALVIYNVGPPVPGPPPPVKIPVITDATYVKKTLTITGREFTAAVRVEINGKLIDQVFEFIPATNSVTIRLKRRKLNLNEADNQIVLIENGERSQPFVLHL